MTRPPSRAARAALAALALLVLPSCALAEDAAPAAAGTGGLLAPIATTAPSAAPAGRPTGPLAPVSAATPTVPVPVLAGARVIGPVLPASAGALVDADVPGASQALNVDVAFGGVQLGSAPDGQRVVGYPSLALQAAFDGTVVAHVKIARFRCPTGPTPATGCRGRTVDYGDADARSTSVEVADDGEVTVQVTAAGYRYGAGVDRAAGVPPRPTGERLHLRAVITPGQVLSREGRRVMWRPLAEVTEVTAARPGTDVVPSGRAVQDDGYPNTYRAVLRAR